MTLIMLCPAHDGEEKEMGRRREDKRGRGEKRRWGKEGRGGEKKGGERTQAYLGLLPYTNPVTRAPPLSSD